MTNQTSENNKRIAKNTIYLYIRMMIMMVVNLYTSRVILESLGVEDYGIYNVVGGVVAMFNFISGSLTAATQRYITIELGKVGRGNLQKVFSTSLQLHAILSLIIVIVAEPIGIWFIQNKLMIPSERIVAAMWIYQLSILSMVVMFMSVPYNGLIVAHEKMSAFAFVSIVDAVIRLLIAYSLLACESYDKLIVYGILMFIAQLINRCCYTMYCKVKFKNCRFKICRDKRLMLDMGHFASWSVFGNLAFVAYTEGLNLLLGMFFMPVVNAARGIAVQVQSAINAFVTGFQTAINPQITKSYAAGNILYMVSLVFRSSKLSYYLLMVLTLPIMIEPDFILNLWLKTVPCYTIPFLRIILVTTWINSVANPLIISVKATGKVRIYESTVGTLMILILPVSYIFLKLHYPPITVFVVHLFFECFAMLFRIWNTKQLIGFSFSDYFNKVILRILIVTFFSVIAPVCISLYIDQHSFRSFLIILLVSLFSSCLSIYLLGLSKEESEFIKAKIRKG